jgi:hypothetical protein
MSTPIILTNPSRPIKAKGKDADMSRQKGSEFLIKLSASKAPFFKPGFQDTGRLWDALLTAIAKARGWIDDIRLGRIASFAEIAEREAQGERHIRLLAHRVRGDAGDTRDRRYAAIAGRLGFRSGKTAPLPFVEMGQYRRIALLERIFIDYLATLRCRAAAGNPLSVPLRPNPIQLFPDGP